MHADQDLTLVEAGDGSPEGWWHEERWDRDWVGQAACLDHRDPEVFFATNNDAVAVAEAKETCLSCPVRSDCLNYALTRDEQDGVWGGLDEEQREALRKRLRLPRPHGTHARYQRHLKDGEEPCDDCRYGHAEYKAQWVAGAHVLDDLEALDEAAG